MKKNKKVIWINLITMIIILIISIISVKPLPVEAIPPWQRTATAQALIPTSAPTATAPNPTATAGGPTPASPAPTATVPATTPTVPSTLIEPEHSYGELNLSGHDVAYLTAGDYVFESIHISGNAELVVLDGPVNIWVTGEVDISGNGFANTSEKPTDLIIYGTGEDLDWHVRGNGIFYGAMYAPDIDLSISGAGARGDVFGAFIGKSVTFNGTGTNIHYDEALGTMDSNSGYKLDKGNMTWILD